MDISVNLRAVYAGISLESFRQIASELEILATKKIPHNERAKALVEDPTVKERKLKVTNFESPLFWYSIEDYAVDDDGKLILIGGANYTSRDLIS